MSSTGRLIIDGCASISAIAFFSVMPSLSLSGSFLNVVPALFSSVFPADRLCPSLKLRLFDAFGLVVVKHIGDAVTVQPGARLLHRVAVLDAVDRDGLRHMLSSTAKRPAPDMLMAAPAD